jgi:hypothetical protein
MTTSATTTAARLLRNGLNKRADSNFPIPGPTLHAPRTLLRWHSAMPLVSIRSGLSDPNADKRPRH